MHPVFYTLHVIGMAIIIISAAYLVLKTDLSEDLRKKISLFLMSASHLQLLTGFILFFIMMSEVNHMKIGIKMLLAVEISILSTIYRKKIASDNRPNKFLLPLIFFSGIAITVIAFLL